MNEQKFEIISCAIEIPNEFEGIIKVPTISEYLVTLGNLSEVQNKNVKMLNERSWSPTSLIIIKSV